MVCKEKNIENVEWQKAKIKRHCDNVRGFTGFLHGRFFKDGVHFKRGGLKNCPKVIFHS